MKLTGAILLGLVACAAGKAVDLNGDNFDSQTAGKNSFVKFLAPW